MVEEVLPLDLNSELQKIFLKIGKDSAYPDPGLESAMARRDRLYLYEMRV
jgi:hypothetical protein